MDIGLYAYMSFLKPMDLDIDTNINITVYISYMAMVARIIRAGGVRLLPISRRLA
jgi:hypothetical protein